MDRFDNQLMFAFGVVILVSYWHLDDFIRMCEPWLILFL
jgi:hypothetical protein